MRKTPNAKRQTPKKHPAANTNARRRVSGLLELVDWSLFGVWFLVFGVYVN
jgi:hypothetical protein